jgi:hypothetical protein
MLDRLIHETFEYSYTQCYLCIESLSIAARHLLAKIEKWSDSRYTECRSNGSQAVHADGASLQTKNASKRDN